jgi:hypothetical protein
MVLISAYYLDLIPQSTCEAFVARADGNKRKLILPVRISK